MMQRQELNRSYGNIKLDYDKTSYTEGIRLKKECGWDLPVMDVLACVGNLNISHSVSLVGFCYGGSLAWKSACLGYGLSCAVSFYGSQIPDFLDLDSKCPILIHLGEKDETNDNLNSNIILGDNSNWQTSLKREPEFNENINESSIKNETKINAQNNVETHIDN